MTPISRTFVAAAFAAMLAAGSAQAEVAFTFDAGRFDLTRPDQVSLFREELDKAAGAFCRKQPSDTGSRTSGRAECRKAVTKQVVSGLSAEQRAALDVKPAQTPMVAER